MNNIYIALYRWGTTNKLMIRSVIIIIIIIIIKQENDYSDVRQQ